MEDGGPNEELTCKLYRIKHEAKQDVVFISPRKQTISAFM